MDIKHRSRLLVVIAGVLTPLMLGMILTLCVAAAPTKITVWLTTYNADVQRLMDETLIPEFERVNPNIKVDVQYISWDDFDSKLITAFAAGIAPDIFQPGAEWRGQLAEQGLVRPIDDLVTEWPAAKDFFPGAWEAVVWKGESFGVPYLTAPRTFWYRADIFNEAGVDPKKPPVTWEEMMDIIPKLTEGSMDGTLIRAALAVPPNDFQFWIPLLWQAGGAFVSEDGNTPLFNSPEGLEAANYYLDLYDYSRSFGTMPYGNIVSGAYAMVYGGPNVARAALRSNSKIGDEVWAASPMKQVQQVTATYTDWLAISTQSKYPVEAFEFIKWLMEPDHLIAYNEAFFFIPPSRAVIDSDYVRMNQAIYQVVELVMPYTVAYPSFNATNRSIFSSLWSKVIRQDSTPQQALEDFARTFAPLKELWGN